MGDEACLGDPELGQEHLGTKGFVLTVSPCKSEEEWGMWRQQLSPGSAIHCWVVLGNSLPLSEPQLFHL